MEKERKVKKLALVAVIVAVLGMTIAFAALSQTLTIKGTGKVDTATWNIHFKNLQFLNKTTNASVNGTPELSEDEVTISNINVTLKQPGDYVTYTVDIKNDGNINAEIQSIDMPTLTSVQSELFTFTAVYTGTTDKVSVGDTLYEGQTRNVTLTFKYKDITDSSLLPEKAEEISLTYSIHYVQSDKETPETTTPASAYGEEIASKQITDTITATYYGGTPIAKVDEGKVKAMAYNKELADNDTRYEGGTLVISGTGEISNETYDITVFLMGAQSMEEMMNSQEKYFDSTKNEYILKYNPNNLIIEEGITSVDEFTFASITSITNISLPSTLKTIEEGAFSGISVRLVNLPNGLQSIGDSSFSRCNYLKTILIPRTVNNIGGDAFSELSTESIIYTETQEVADLISGKYDSSTTTVIVDPTKFN